MPSYGDYYSGSFNTGRRGGGGAGLPNDLGGLTRDQMPLGYLPSQRSVGYQGGGSPEGTRAGWGGPIPNVGPVNNTLPSYMTDPQAHMRTPGAVGAPRGPLPLKAHLREALERRRLENMGMEHLLPSQGFSSLFPGQLNLGALSGYGAMRL